MLLNIDALKPAMVNMHAFEYFSAKPLNAIKIESVDGTFVGLKSTSSRIGFFGILSVGFSAIDN